MFSKGNSRVSILSIEVGVHSGCCLSVTIKHRSTIIQIEICLFITGMYLHRSVYVNNTDNKQQQCNSMDTPSPRLQCGLKEAGQC